MPSTPGSYREFTRPSSKIALLTSRTVSARRRSARADASAAGRARINVRCDSESCGLKLERHAVASRTQRAMSSVHTRPWPDGVTGWSPVACEVQAARERASAAQTSPAPVSATSPGKLAIARQVGRGRRSRRSIRVAYSPSIAPHQVSSPGPAGRVRGFRRCAAAVQGPVVPFFFRRWIGAEDAVPLWSRRTGKFSARRAVDRAVDDAHGRRDAWGPEHRAPCSAPAPAKAAWRRRKPKAGTAAPGWRWRTVKTMVRGRARHARATSPGGPAHHGSRRAPSPDLS